MTHILGVQHEVLTCVVVDIPTTPVSIGVLPLLGMLQTALACSTLLHILSESSCSRHMGVSLQAQKLQGMLVII